MIRRIIAIAFLLAALQAEAQTYPAEMVGLWSWQTLNPIQAPGEVSGEHTAVYLRFYPNGSGLVVAQDGTAPCLWNWTDGQLWMTFGKDFSYNFLYRPALGSYFLLSGDKLIVMTRLYKDPDTEIAW